MTTLSHPPRARPDAVSDLPRPPPRSGPRGAGGVPAGSGSVAGWGPATPEDPLSSRLSCMDRPRLLTPARPTGMTPAQRARTRCRRRRGPGRCPGAPAAAPTNRPRPAPATFATGNAGGVYADVRRRAGEAGQRGHRHGAHAGAAPTVRWRTCRMLATGAADLGFSTCRTRRWTPMRAPDHVQQRPAEVHRTGPDLRQLRARRGPDSRSTIDELKHLRRPQSWSASARRTPGPGWSRT